MASQYKNVATEESRISLNHSPLHINTRICDMSKDNKNRYTMVAAQIQASTVISRIEYVFESMVDCILGSKKELVVQLKLRTHLRNGFSASDKSTQRLRNISFPSKKPREAWKFTVLIRILELCHEALTAGILMTKRSRDIYYREPELFKRQSIVDRYIDEIAYTFGVERLALNVVAAAKGLMAGSLTIIQHGCPAIDYSFATEATFQTLASSLYWKSSKAGNGILITAKGYPDIQTRRFLNLIAVKFPDIPIFALMDFDPDGIAILAVYKFNSANLSHEPHIAVPSIKWLGIQSCDILPCPINSQSFMSLSTRDRKFATNFMQKHFHTGTLTLNWKNELQTMLMLNVKAEIQILGGASVLSRWLDDKLRESLSRIKSEENSANQ
ncbi:unnamed protein product [Blumeria hordei]|uniref:DNA topoisomerase (ATP-hydrolyzing) n=1 Tax=Blumeria hordei TaxID=2867405 RepID=A0A383UJN9_BLUHO|nr:unnamed protein product [Blumeria hordei]